MLIDIDKIKVHDRIRKDLGNIDELAEDIRENGLINPPVVTPDLVLIAGERRLRACQKLGWKQIEVRVMTVRDAEHQLLLEISENENRLGFSYKEKIEMGIRLERILRIKAEERMKAGQKIDPVENFPQGKTRDIVAKTVGFGSGKQYEKAKFIAEHGDEELIARVDSGEISIHKAYTEIKNKLKQEEEARLKAEQRAQEAESRLADAVSQSNKQIRELQEQLQRAKEEVKVKEIVKEVPSRELLDKIAELERKLNEETEKQKALQAELRKKEDELLALTQEELRLKERHQIYENVNYLTRDVEKWLGKLEIDLHRRAHIEGDAEVHRTIEACIKVLQEAIQRLQKWTNLPERRVVDAEYAVVEST